MKNTPEPGERLRNSDLVENLTELVEISLLRRHPHEGRRREEDVVRLVAWLSPRELDLGGAHEGVAVYAEDGAAMIPLDERSPLHRGSFALALEGVDLPINVEGRQQSEKRSLITF